MAVHPATNGRWLAEPLVPAAAGRGQPPPAPRRRWTAPPLAAPAPRSAAARAATPELRLQGKRGRKEGKARHSRARKGGGRRRPCSAESQWSCSSPPRRAQAMAAQRSPRRGGRPPSSEPVRRRPAPVRRRPAPIRSREDQICAGLKPRRRRRSTRGGAAWRSCGGGAAWRSHGDSRGTGDGGAVPTRAPASSCARTPA